MKNNIFKFISCVISLSLLTGCGTSYSPNYSDCATEAQYAPADEDRFLISNDMEQGFDVNEGMVGAAECVDNSCIPYEKIEINTEEYNSLTENPYHSVSAEPLSTFSADVDTASYTNVRRMIYDGFDVNPDAVRIEEMINYFDYNYSNPKDNEPFAIHTELSDCPWNEDARLLMVGINTESIDTLLEDRPPMNLVFLIDVSGSMHNEDKLPLVQQSFSMLTENLDAKDRISIVTYAGSDEIVLEGGDGNDKDKVLSAINSLQAGGSTAGAAGITTAYELAEKYFIEGGNNRVILATDGDLNVGLSSEKELTELIEKKRESGVFLSVLGFGSGNYKDNRLEALADHGNGNYSYIDSKSEAKKVLVDEMGGTLFTVAKDVKFQVEFNPMNVSKYRLIGYENRQLANEDFNDDTKDAGEIGAGHSVTVLYEIIPAGSIDENDITLKYSAINDEAVSDELLTVKIRYKEPDADESKLLEYIVNNSQYDSQMSSDMNFAACVAEFGMLLRNSDYSGSVTYEHILEALDRYDYSDDEYKDEFEYLVKTMERRN